MLKFVIEKTVHQHYIVAEKDFTILSNIYYLKKIYVGLYVTCMQCDSNFLFATRWTLKSKIVSSFVFTNI